MRDNEQGRFKVRWADMDENGKGVVIMVGIFLFLVVAQWFS